MGVSTMHNTDEDSVTSVGAIDVEVLSRAGEGTSRDAIHVESDFGDTDSSKDGGNEEGLGDMDGDGDALGRGEEAELSVSKNNHSFDLANEHDKDVQF